MVEPYKSSLSALICTSIRNFFESKLHTKIFANRNVEARVSRNLRSIFSKIFFATIVPGNAWGINRAGRLQGYGLRFLRNYIIIERGKKPEWSDDPCEPHCNAIVLSAQGFKAAASTRSAKRVFHFQYIYIFITIFFLCSRYRHGTGTCPYESDAQAKHWYWI